MQIITPLINNDWDIILKDEFQKKYFKNLIKNIEDERKNYTVYPKEQYVFEAFKLCPFSKTKIVILGQDPYHAKGQAHGLAFSVPNGIKIPPSLKNIFKEIKSDMETEITSNGNLSNWAKQGVLLLNTTLTVREKEATAHKSLGWEDFTDSVIKILSKRKKNLVFLLWGSFAKQKMSFINNNNHHILKTTHPSPLSAYRGFFGCKHFSKTNKYLLKYKKKPIKWGQCSDTLSLF